MALPRILKNFNLFVDGRGYAGKVDELELPDLKIKEEEHRAGGMDAPAMIDMGMEAMEMKFTLAEITLEVTSQFGLVDGAAVGITARGAMQRDGEPVVPVVANARGRIKEMGTGTWKAGDKATTECTMSLRYYRLEVGGLTTIEIDVDNMIRVIGGVDQLAQVRAAIGA
jgi:P2 family phage contractile tail tube protein